VQTLVAARSPHRRLAKCFRPEGNLDLTSQGCTQAAWNRIPIVAWCRIVLIANYCNGLIGCRTRRATTAVTLFLVLPLALSASFFFIADIDSPMAESFEGVLEV
jgi:hypothetical protein